MVNFDYDLQSIQEARDLIRKGDKASKEIKDYSHDKIDEILRNIVDIIEDNAYMLGEMAHNETGFGKPLDKAYKNHASATLLYNEIKDEKVNGIIAEDKLKGTMDVAEPVGLIMGIIPSTNPTSTVVFKAMIAIKSQNAILFSPHPAAKNCILKTVELIKSAIVKAGANPDIVNTVTMPTIETTNEIMKAKEIKLIIATGGPGMVKAAYSAGKPALGVGAGNSPAYIEKTADVEKAIKMIMASKTFDNGTICASEQSIVCEESNANQVIHEITRQGGYFMTPEETKKVCSLLFKNGHTMSAAFVGRSAEIIARAAGIDVPAGTKVLVGEQGGVGPEYPLSYEKLTCVLAFYRVKDWEEACNLSIELLQNGLGHTMSIHTQDPNIVHKFSIKPASRILINTGGSMGGTGLSTGLPISFTLGCGTSGGSSVSENVGPKHLMNLKKIAYGMVDVTTMMENDKTFRVNKNCTSCHSEEKSKPIYEQGVKMTVSSCGTPIPDSSNWNIPAMSKSPAEIQASFEDKKVYVDREKQIEDNIHEITKADVDTDTEGLSAQDLKDMVRELLASMN